MNAVAKFEFPVFKQSAHATDLENQSRKMLKGVKRVERHLRGKRGTEVLRHYPRELGRLVGDAAAKLDKYEKAWEGKQREYALTERREREEWVCAGTAAFEEFLEQQGEAVVPREIVEVLRVGAVRWYNSTFGQTSAGCHASSSLQMNQHVLLSDRDPAHAQVSISSTKVSDLGHGEYYPPKLRDQMRAALSTKSEVSYDADNLAYQRHLMGR